MDQMVVVVFIRSDIKLRGYISIFRFRIVFFSGGESALQLKIK